VHFNDKLPSNSSTITKTGTTILQEFYVSNETGIAVGYLILFVHIATVRHSVLGCEFLSVFFIHSLMLIKICVCMNADHPPALQGVGGEPHCSHHVLAQRRA
jgi:hypothetical protein